MSTLSSLMQRQLATLTVETSATFKMPKTETVATVAIVTVANLRMRPSWSSK